MWIRSVAGWAYTKFGRVGGVRVHTGESVVPCVRQLGKSSIPVVWNLVGTELLAAVNLVFVAVGGGRLLQTNYASSNRRGQLVVGSPPV